MNNATRVNPQRDSLVENVNNAIGRSLSTVDFRTLEMSPHIWNEKLHTKALLNMYLDKIRQRSIRVRVVEAARLQEPIMLYFYKRRTGDTVVHTVCADYVKLLFSVEPTFVVESAKKRVKEFKLPKQFSIQRSDGSDDRIRLSRELSRKLSILYCVADHAAYHYFAYETHKKVDYEHSENYTIPGEFFLHDLFTKEKNAKIAAILSDSKRRGNDLIAIYEEDAIDDDSDDQSTDDSTDSEQY